MYAHYRDTLEQIDVSRELIRKYPQVCTSQSYTSPNFQRFPLDFWTCQNLSRNKGCYQTWQNCQPLWCWRWTSARELPRGATAILWAWCSIHYFDPHLSQCVRGFLRLYPWYHTQMERTQVCCLCLLCQYSASHVRIWIRFQSSWQIFNRRNEPTRHACGLEPHIWRDRTSSSEAEQGE